MVFETRGRPIISTPGLKPGMVVGRWKLIRYIGNGGKWLVRCTCKYATLQQVAAAHLIHGKSRGCGHHRGRLPTKAVTDRDQALLDALKELPRPSYAALGRRFGISKQRVFQILRRLCKKECRG